MKCGVSPHKQYACEMLCFTIESAVGRREGRWCQTAGAGYARRLCSAMVGVVRTVMVVERFAALCFWDMQLQIARGRVMVGGAGLQMAVLCCWEMQLQIAGRLITVG